MPRIFRLTASPDPRPACALTIGNFDGVHRGHQAILARVRQEARARGLAPAVMTFEPHPREYFAALYQRPELAPTRISGLRDKLFALIQAGMEEIFVRRFDARLAGMSANSFIEDLLVRDLNVRWLLVGEDFRFGHKRSGDIELLREAGLVQGFEVRTLADVADAHGHRISSSEVRTALAVGDLPHAQHLLGHPYRLSGHVIHGQKLGRQLGFPTMNLRVPPRCAVRSGIYVVRVLGLNAKPLPGVASLGVRPTVEDGGRILLEVHALDDPCAAGPRQDGQAPAQGKQPEGPGAQALSHAYGKLVSIEFLRHLRDEEKFPDLPALTAAIAEDARNARAYFAVHARL